jgi:hypothetical protein
MRAVSILHLLTLVTHSDGAMLPSTASVQHYLLGKTKSTSSMILAIGTSHFNTVRKAIHINGANAGVTKRTTLVRAKPQLVDCLLLTYASLTDYEWYSCLKRYDNLF